MGFADASMGVMALINLTAILALSGTVVLVLRDFDEQVASGRRLYLTAVSSRSLIKPWMRMYGLSTAQIGFSRERW